MASQLLSGRSILIAEDEYMLASAIRRELQAEGAVIVGPAPTLERTLDLIERHTALDAAILDINLQGIKVFPAADVLRERGIPFVFATGYDTTIIPSHFADVVRCEKPVESGKIAAALARVIKP